MLKWVDMPPVWLAGAVAVVWALDHAVPFGVFGALAAFGPALVVTGLVLIVGAVVQMTAHRTTFIPRSAPSALVSTGFFRICRNPIYLGDALVLLGVILLWDAPLGLLLLAAFVRVITVRFIQPEEAVLWAVFGADFDAWAEQTGRWLPRGLRFFGDAANRR